MPMEHKATWHGLRPKLKRVAENPAYPTAAAADALAAELLAYAGTVGDEVGTGPRMACPECGGTHDNLQTRALCLSNEVGRLRAIIESARLALNGDG